MMEARTRGCYTGSRGGTEDQRTEGWSECFQDLASWCLLPQDELNTPQALHDEFNFSVGQGRDCTWDVSSPVDLQSDLWETPDLNLLSSPLLIDEDNNMDSRSLLSNDKTQQKDKKFNSGNAIKENPIRSNGNLLLSQSSLNSTDVLTEKELGVFSLFKSEEPIISSITAAKLNSSSSPMIKSEKSDKGNSKESVLVKQEKPFGNEKENNAFKVPQMSEVEKKERPKLKLNIGAATSASSYSCSLDTPDVMRSLTEESTGFDILSFINGDFDDPNVLIADPSNLTITPGLDAVNSRLADPLAIKSDHDYTETRMEVTENQVFQVKSEPLSPLKNDEDKRKPVKRRSTVSSEEYQCDSDASSDGSVEWSPSPYKKKSKSVKRKSQKTKTTGKKPRKYSVDSDSESIKSGPDRYRELRDRNNEASRKSRLNRKQKEIQMNQLAQSLEEQNTFLKSKADSLEKLVKKLRDTLLNIVMRK